MEMKTTMDGIGIFVGRCCKLYLLAFYLVVFCLRYCNVNMVLLTAITFIRTTFLDALASGLIADIFFGTIAQITGSNDTQLAVVRPVRRASFFSLWGLIQLTG